MSILGKVSLGRLTKIDRRFLLFKLVLAVMLFLPLMQSPSFRGSVTGILLLVWVIVSIAGLATSAIGLILGAQGPNTRHRGFRIEMGGLVLLLTSPLAFSAVHIGLAFTPGARASLLAIMFPLVIAAAIWARMAMVEHSMKTVLYRFPGEERND